MPTHLSEEELKKLRGLGGDSVSGIAHRLMGQDSPLMQRAAATGRQFGNRRGLMNSTLSAQAAQGAALDFIVPMASQTSDQRFRSRLQESAQDFAGAESGLERGFRSGESALERQFKETEFEAERGFRSGESALERDFKGSEFEAERGFKSGESELTRQFEGSESQAERDLKLSIVDKDVDLQREKILSDENIASADRALKKIIASDEISNNDRRGAESTLDNAYRDYQLDLQSIMSNPDLSSADRNKLLTDAKNMLTAKIDYATDLYGTAFDFPPNPFTGVTTTGTTGTTSTDTTSKSTDSGLISAPKTKLTNYFPRASIPGESSR